MLFYLIMVMDSWNVGMVLAVLEVWFELFYRFWLSMFFFLVFDLYVGLRFVLRLGSLKVGCYSLNVGLAVWEFCDLRMVWGIGFELFYSFGDFVVSCRFVTCFENGW